MSLQGSTFLLSTRTDTAAALPRVFLACCQRVLHSPAVGDEELLVLVLVLVLMLMRMLMLTLMLMLMLRWVKAWMINLLARGPRWESAPHRSWSLDRWSSF